MQGTSSQTVGIFKRRGYEYQGERDPWIGLCCCEDQVPWNLQHLDNGLLLPFRG
ncbi:uncharacterized protein [Blastocystis hominis]|uniref:Uncharacterized protein n=1 Tax=Blastocystis hominis TaxID=12968 RepID=D8M456_BLAHO|nr:uncharacterized protein [Blastocystis hominis]CBK22845.2 unnamed protein product [Blastocystis hominis]|eukprot:XP_012896893.1 uncharacterized protein [Blastocystis hominis]